MTTRLEFSPKKAIACSVPCVDVYGPRPIATGFGRFWIGGHNC